MPDESKGRQELLILSLIFCPILLVVGVVSLGPCWGSVLGGFAAALFFGFTRFLSRSLAVSAERKAQANEAHALTGPVAGPVLSRPPPRAHSVEPIPIPTRASAPEFNEVASGSESLAEAMSPRETEEPHAELKRLAALREQFPREAAPAARQSLVSLAAGRKSDAASFGGEAIQMALVRGEKQLALEVLAELVSNGSGPHLESESWAAVGIIAAGSDRLDLARHCKHQAVSEDEPGRQLQKLERLLADVGDP